KELNPRFDDARIRAPLFYGGLVLIALASVGLVILVSQRPLVMSVLIVVAIIGLMGLVCVIVRAKPLQVFMFKNKSGSYVFEIIGSGRNAEQAQQFASLIEQ